MKEIDQTERFSNRLLWINTKEYVNVKTNNKNNTINQLVGIK